jgi:hypothetical protein
MVVDRLLRQPNAVRLRYANRILSTKLGIIVHNFAHQLFDQLLPDCANLPAGRSLRWRQSFIRFTGIDFV